jgi:uncharacterized protein (TIGR02678 family)
MRRLLDDPVVYFDDLDLDERQYLQAAVGPLTTWVMEAGLRLERRAEGWAAIDESEEATDVVFPQPHSIVKQAALLVLDRLVADRCQAPSASWVAAGRIQAEVATLLAAHPRWARTYQDDRGPALLAQHVLDLLIGLRLLRRERGGVRLLPAAARYRAGTVNAGPSRSGPPPSATRSRPRHESLDDQLPLLAADDDHSQHAASPQEASRS